MVNTLLETLETAVTFSSANWHELSGAVADAFRFTKKERESFLGNNLPRLIAAIPFLAGCDDPERTAISHLGTYVLSIRAKKYALAKPSDDEYVLKRLELLRNFSGGNADIISRGMNLIALCMINDYAADIEDDRDAAKYNPVGNGAMDYYEIRENLIKEIKAVECVEMDEIMTLSITSMFFWEL